MPSVLGQNFGVAIKKQIAVVIFVCKLWDICEYNPELQVLYEIHTNSLVPSLDVGFPFMISGSRKEKRSTNSSSFEIYMN